MGNRLFFTNTKGKQEERPHAETQSSQRNTEDFYHEPLEPTRTKEKRKKENKRTTNNYEATRFHIFFFFISYFFFWVTVTGRVP